LELNVPAKGQRFTTVVGEGAPEDDRVEEIMGRSVLVRDGVEIEVVEDARVLLCTVELATTELGF
jgi:hypothetical protein